MTGTEAAPPDASTAAGHPMDDPAFAFLAEAFDPATATPVLERALGTPLRSARATPFRHRTGRRSLLRIDLETEAGPLRVLGKVRAKGADRRTQRLMGALRGAGFDEAAADGVAVPEPLAVVDAWRMVVHAWVEAPSATEVLSVADGAGRREMVDRMRGALAKLHAAPVPVERTHGLDEELAVLARQLSAAASAAPALAPRLERVLAACVALAAGIAPAPARLAHRDFYPDQVLVAADRTYLVDLDLVARAHPALDLGNLAAHLVEHALRLEGDPHAFDDLVARATVRTVEGAEPDAIDRFATLSLARLVAVSRRIPERRPTTERLLRLVEARLGGA